MSVPARMKHPIVVITLLLGTVVGCGTSPPRRAFEEFVEMGEGHIVTQRKKQLEQDNVDARTRAMVAAGLEPVTLSALNPVWSDEEWARFEEKAHLSTAPRVVDLGKSGSFLGGIIDATALAQSADGTIYIVEPSRIRTEAYHVDGCSHGGVDESRHFGQGFLVLPEGARFGGVRRLDFERVDISLTYSNASECFTLP